MNRPLSGLYVITDKKLVPRDRFIEAVDRAIRGGARVVQLREKDTSEEGIVKLGKGLLEVTRGRSVPLIINDSPRLAKEIGADGVHIGQYDALVPEVREMVGSDAIIGVSCYGDILRGIQAEREGADYVSFGTPYFTPTKPDRKSTPFEVLREAKMRITTIPVFAIGGITRENAPSVLETGVDGICVITSVFGSPDPEKASRELATLFEV